MLSTTEQTIWKAMESVTGPEHLERVKKMRDFAFVHFVDRDSAKAAMDYWHSKLHMIRYDIFVDCNWVVTRWQ